MALVAAQKRQTLRLPTPDATVDSIDKLAFLGIWQVESVASDLSTNQKRWILRLPIVDAAVDELDAWGFLQIPASGGAGNQTEGFGLSWSIDPTWTTSFPEIDIDGSISRTLGNLISGFVGIVTGGGKSRANVFRGEGRRKRFSVRIDNEYILVNSPDEAEALLKAQAQPRERIKRRKQRARVLERLRPNIPVSEQMQSLGDNFGEVADAAVRNIEVLRTFNDAVAQQSMAALGALRLEIENAQRMPEPAFVPLEIQISPEEQQLADELMGQVGLFDEVLGAFLRGISEAERNAYREMDEMMAHMKKDNSEVRNWADDRITVKRKRFDAFRKVFGKS